MGCRLCGRGACTASFHSAEEQRRHDPTSCPECVDHLQELATLRAEVTRVREELKASTVSEAQMADRVSSLSMGASELQRYRIAASDRWHAEAERDVLREQVSALRNKIERQDAALERLSERAEAAESAVDVLEKELAKVREDRLRAVQAMAVARRAAQDAQSSRDVAAGLLYERTAEVQRLTAQLAAERERYEVALNEAITDERHTAGERAGLRMAAALFRALPASEG